ncbi:MAG: hydrogenase nickel incorporation protein HypB [Promethearchaeota archaeon]
MQPEKNLKVIDLNENLIEHNEFLAEQNKETFSKYDIKTFDIVGAIGAGKTSLLEAIIDKIEGKKRILVINGDVTSRIDANRISAHGVKTIQINTGRECALNAYHISRVIKNFDLSKFDIVFIENVGNLICPSDFILGADKRVVVVSVTEGEWVIQKHPLLFKLSDIAVINKIDLLDILDINLESMINDAKQINPNIQVFPVSAKTRTNIDDLIKTMFA